MPRYDPMEAFPAEAFPAEAFPQPAGRRRDEPSSTPEAQGSSPGLEPSEQDARAGWAGGTGPWHPRLPGSLTLCGL